MSTEDARRGIIYLIGYIQYLTLIFSRAQGDIAQILDAVASTLVGYSAFVI
jgi:hypothetical protein